MEMTKGAPLLQILVLFLALCCLRVCMAINYITITRTLRDPETIFSTDQSFKLGFFSPPNTTKRYVGIMFNLPVSTVIWVANRDKPLNDSSGTFTISEDGNLVVLNGEKEILWSSNVSNLSANCSAKLADSGNLFLQENGRTVWESFQYPTDSFVNNTRISATSATNEKRRLRSWRSPSDPSPGDFSFGLEVLQTAQMLIWNGSKRLWRSGPWNGIFFIGMSNMNSVYNSGLEFVDDSTESAYFVLNFSKGAFPVTYFQLTSEGTYEHKVWQEEKREWQVKKSNIQTQCDAYGKCGPFGNCNSQDSSVCTCLKGFEPRDKEEWVKGNWSGGCTRRKPLQCGRNASTGEDGYVRLTKMKVPDFPEWQSNQEGNCATRCLKNCSCIAYAYYAGLGCMHWSGNLFDIQQFQQGGADLYIRVAHSELDNNKDITAITASTVVVGILVVLGSAYLCWKLWDKHRGNKQEPEEPLFEDVGTHQMGSVETNNFKQVRLEELPLYTYKSLANATDNFHSANELGKGGFGQVFKGELLDGQEIAVKRLSKTSGQGTKEFMNEVLLISKLQHRNLVRLLGCCVEREEKLLIYEYMPNGSLDNYLFDNSKQYVLNWRRRALIIEGIGRGLLYLHRDSRLKIIHRDLKASNILLDEELNPKISDFGLARILGGKQDQDNTRRIVGTYGYMSPEYAMLGRFSEKSDVYSFGVLLLEIITGRRNSSFSHGEDELSLLRYAWELWNEGNVAKLIDPAILEPGIEMQIRTYVQVALLCVQELEKVRPNVSTILSMFNSEISELPLPKLPAFTGTVVSLESASSPEIPHSVNDYTVTVIEAR